MTILVVRRLLFLGVLVAGGVALAAWGLAFGVPLESVDEGEVKVNVLSGVGGDGEAPHPRPLAGVNPKTGEGGARQEAITLARFEGRRWQRGVIDPPPPPAPIVHAPVNIPVPLVQLPPDIQLVGVLVGSTAETSSAFLKIASGPVETVRIGTGPKARPDVVVTEITREIVTVRYQGQLFPLKVMGVGNSVLRRVE